MTTPPKQPQQKEAAQPKPLPFPPLAAHAVPGAVEPLVLSSPPAGRSGDLRVRKVLHDALSANPHLIGPHVVRVRAFFNQHMDGVRSVNLRLDLDEEFPNLPLPTLPERLQPLTQAAIARARAVLGSDMLLMPVAFGGKKLR